MPELDGKVAIVTGAGRLRGIGRGAAVAFARLGADVVVTGTGRSPDRYPPDEKLSAGATSRAPPSRCAPRAHAPFPLSWMSLTRRVFRIWSSAQSSTSSAE